jgi:hypothetical protein
MADCRMKQRARPPGALRSKQTYAPTVFQLHCLYKVKWWESERLFGKGRLSWRVLMLCTVRLQEQRNSGKTASLWARTWTGSVYGTNWAAVQPRRLKYSAIGLWKYCCDCGNLGVWQSVVFPSMKVRILFYTIDLTLCLNNFLLFTVATCFVFYTKAIMRLNHYNTY